MKRSVSEIKPGSALILADIEGIVGVFQKEQCKAGSRKWKSARELITGDVNAAIRGIRAAGIQKIIVRDMHGPGYNILAKKLEPGVHCIQGHFWKPVQLLGAIPNADCAVMIGWHAGPDQKEAFSPHIFHKRIRCVKINGSPVTEVELVAAVLGEFGIPVVFITADKPAAWRMKKNLPWVRSLEIPKRKISVHQRRSIHFVIKNRVRKSVIRSDKARPHILGGHTVEIETARGKFIRKSRSGIQTLEIILAESVFKRCPPLFRPFVFFLYCLRFRILYG